MRYTLMTNPLRTMREIEKQMDQMLHDYWGEGEREREKNYTPVNFVPACDLEETEGHFVLSVDLPGIAKDEVKVEVNNNVLTIAGERRRENKMQQGTTKFIERSYGSYCRSFTLPSGVDAEQIEANFNEGVLTLAIPKTEASKTKQIKIGEGKGGFFSKLIGNTSDNKEKH